MTVAAAVRGSQGRAKGEKNNKKKNGRIGLRGWEVESRAGTRTDRQIWENMSAAHVVSKSVSVSCACKTREELIETRDDITERDSARPNLMFA